MLYVNQERGFLQYIQTINSDISLVRIYVNLYWTFINIKNFIKRLSLKFSYKCQYIFGSFQS